MTEERSLSLTDEAEVKLRPGSTGELGVPVFVVPRKD
jgi:hypothetical protein